MHLYFPTTIYKHQTYSMIFIIIFDTILLFITTFLKIFKNINVDTVENSNIYEKEGYFKCFFIFIVFINITFFLSFARIRSKILIDIKFLSPYAIIFLIGIIGLILNILFCVCLNVNKNYIVDEKEKHIYNYGDISNYFSKFSTIKGYEIFLEIMLTIFYIFFSFLIITFEFSIIKYLNPNYILMSDNIYFEIVKLDDFFIKYPENLENWFYFLISQLAEILEFIGCIIYLEIIELRFCGLNKNTKEKIKIRALSDVINSDNSIYSNEEDNHINNDENKKETELYYIN